VARFLFATEDGTIVGWAPNVLPQTLGIIAAPDCPLAANGPVYTGIALGEIGSNPFLYLANFRGGVVEVFDGAFHAQNFGPSAFVDPNLPPLFAPFNVAVIDGKLYVAFAAKNPATGEEVRGGGFVSVFDTDGRFVQRIAGPLAAPWGMALAPQSFGELGGKLLIGNFGDGKIHAFDPATGVFAGTVRDPEGKAIVIDGLWGLQFGNDGNGGRSDTLYFTAGPDKEKHGLFGSLSVNLD
jgi:uncharacterized protein (TIGR03118 family)